MIPIKNVEFLTPIGPSYDRNNKSTGHKSLRCFPACRKTGHVVRGYCGQPIVAQFDVPHEIGLAIEANRVLVVAEIHSTNVAGLSSCTQLVSAAIILDNVRCNNNVNKNPIFGGEVDSIVHMPPVSSAAAASGSASTGSSSESGLSRLRVSFNKESQSWNYGWLSNRWNTESHVVDVIVFGHVLDFRPTLLRLAPHNPAAAAAAVAAGEEGAGLHPSDDESCAYVALGSFQSSAFVICCTKDVSAGKVDRNAHGHGEASLLKASKKRAVLELRVRKLEAAAALAGPKVLSSDKRAKREVGWVAEEEAGADGASSDSEVAMYRPARNQRRRWPKAADISAAAPPPANAAVEGGLSGAGLLEDLYRVASGGRPTATTARGPLAVAAAAAAGVGPDRVLSGAQQRQLLLLQQLQYDILVGGKDLDRPRDQHEVMRLLSGGGGGSSSSRESVATVVSEGEGDQAGGGEGLGGADGALAASLLALGQASPLTCLVDTPTDPAPITVDPAPVGQAHVQGQGALVVDSSKYDFERRRQQEARALLAPSMRNASS